MKHVHLPCRLYSAISSHYREVARTLHQIRNATGGCHSRVPGLKKQVFSCGPRKRFIVRLSSLLPLPLWIQLATTVTERTKSTSRVPIWGQPELFHCRCVSPIIWVNNRTDNSLRRLAFSGAATTADTRLPGGLAQLPSHTKSSSRTLEHRSHILVTSLKAINSYMFIKCDIKYLPQIVSSLTHRPQILSWSQSCGIQPNNNGSFAQKYILLYLPVTFFLTSPLCQFFLTISSPPF